MSSLKCTLLRPRCKKTTIFFEINIEKAVLATCFASTYIQKNAPWNINIKTYNLSSDIKFKTNALKSSLNANFRTKLVQINLKVVINKMFSPSKICGCVSKEHFPSKLLS